MTADRGSDIETVAVDPSASIAEAMSLLDRAGTGAVVLCTPSGQLAGFLTDGDIRRAILRGASLAAPCETIANPNPMTALASLSDEEAMSLMALHDIDHLPVVDDQGKFVRLLLRKDLIAKTDLEEQRRRSLSSVVIPRGISVGEAISRLDQAGTGGLALCAEGGRLLGVLTDGDVRRAILRGVALDSPCADIANLTPIAERAPVSKPEALRIMNRHDVNHLPVIDDEGNLVELLLRRDLVENKPLTLSAVVMAGGFGRRLLPLTEHVPKPMLPLGDRPLLERTIEQLRRSGILDVSLTTHYLPEAIVEHFGNGEAFGVRISYSREDEPLGTAGGLRLIERPKGPFVVVNGDVVTDVPFAEMLHYHRENGAELTVGVRQHRIDVPFGVVECDDIRITDLREKPSLTLFINAGVYLLEPFVCDYIPEGQRFDMTDLIRKMLHEGRTVVSFPIIEYWQDVGRPEDYRQAQSDLRDQLI